MSIRRAVLFRYHKHQDVCANRLRLLRRLNPGIAIYGMYGGEKREKAWALDLDDDYALPFTDTRFKWEHGDLCVRRWFKDTGWRFSFDMLHVIEWDMILLKPLDEVLAHVREGIALTALKPLKELKKEGWGWITQPDRQEQFKELCAFVLEKYGVTIDPDHQKAGVFGGASLSRSFLERYAEDDIPKLTHDEIRTAVFAVAFGMPLADTNLRQEVRFFNCDKDYLSAGEVYANASRFAVFHPVKAIIDMDRLMSSRS